MKMSDEQIELLVTEIIGRFGDLQSGKYYRLVACKVTHEVITEAMSRISNDGGARHPARVFTKRMETYANKAFGEMRKSAEALKP